MDLDYKIQKLGFLELQERVKYLEQENKELKEEILDLREEIDQLQWSMGI